MTLDAKALDAAERALVDAGIDDMICRDIANLAIREYIDHALPALLAAAERRGIERAAVVAIPNPWTSSMPGWNSDSEDDPVRRQNEGDRLAANRIAAAIRALKEPTP